MLPQACNTLTTQKIAQLCTHILWCRCATAITIQSVTQNKQGKQSFTRKLWNCGQTIWCCHGFAHQQAMAHGATALCPCFCFKAWMCVFFVCLSVCVRACGAPWPLPCCYAEHSIAQYVVVVVCRIVVVNRCVGLLVMAGWTSRPKAWWLHLHSINAIFYGRPSPCGRLSCLGKGFLLRCFQELS